jgi:hypothetical protein
MSPALIQYQDGFEHHTTNLLDAIPKNPARRASERPEESSWSQNFPPAKGGRGEQIG